MFCRFHLQADFYDDCCTNVRCQKGPDMIRNPEYFIAIVESGSLTKAAKKLYLSQPYLSQYLKQLEQSLGVELFDHSVSPLTPTYAGQLFYRYLLRQIHQEENFRQLITDLKNEDAGRILECHTGAHPAHSPLSFRNFTGNIRRSSWNSAPPHFRRN